MQKLFIAFLLVFSVSFGATTTTKKSTISVYGNCGMCKKTIESALKISAIKGASWNPDSKKLKISYLPSEISLDSIERRIAAVGYDTEHHRASDLEYNSLHKCCKYVRKEK